jgi:Adenylate cyclase, family 3 (some proteins contain HAMP domain)
MKIDNQNTTYNNILSILVPNFVKNLLNRGIRFLAEDQGKVAILFCDICDFDHIIATKGPAVVDILDKLWRQFDKFCAEHGVQKIEVILETLLFIVLDCWKNLYGMWRSQIY